MLQRVCPSCEGLLNIPDSGEGKLIRCPLCSHVFKEGTSQAGESQANSLPFSQAISSAPLPANSELNSFAFAQTSRSGAFDSSQEFDFSEVYNAADQLRAIRAQTLANGAAAWLLLAAICNSLNIILSIYLGLIILHLGFSPWSLPSFELCLLFSVVVDGFLFAGSVLLPSFRRRGVVFTSAILALVQGAGFLVSFVTFLGNLQIGGLSATWPLIFPLFWSLSALVNVLAGVKVLIGLHNPNVLEAYSASQRRF